MNKELRGFTLAEVLITLTIIGVIAALTIPNLMQSYKKHQVEVSLKEAYSILSNAMKMSVAENGDTNDWTYAYGEGFAKKYVTPYLKINYVCSSTKPCFDNNGWNTASGTQISGAGGGYGPDYFYKLKLQNGMDLGVWAVSNSTNATSIYGSIISACFIVDINGKTGKSTLGKDVFSFPYILIQNNPYYPAYKIGTIESRILCSGQNGENYTNLIIKNGWKIPDNYPIKKF